MVPGRGGSVLARRRSSKGTPLPSSGGITLRANDFLILHVVFALAEDDEDYPLIGGVRGLRLLERRVDIDRPADESAVDDRVNLEGVRSTWRHGSFDADRNARRVTFSSLLRKGAASAVGVCDDHRMAGAIGADSNRRRSALLARKLIRPRGVYGLLGPGEDLL